MPHKYNYPLVNTLVIAGAVFIAGAVQAQTFLSFTDLDNANNDTVTVGGDGSGTVTAGRTVQDVSGTNDYLFSFSYNGSDFNGDSTNDTLTFKVRVSAQSGSTVSSVTEPGPEGQNYTGSVTLGSTQDDVGNDGTKFVNETIMAAGDTLVFTIEDLSLGALTGYQATLNGFDQFSMVEWDGNSHQSVVGTGTGLFVADTNLARTISLTGIAAEGGDTGYQSTLYITAKNPDSGTRPQRWGVEDLGFDITVAAIPESSSYALLAGLLGLSYVMIRRRQA